MASIIKLKRSSTPGAVPSSLEEGELAINTADQRLHSANSSSVFTLFDGAQALQKTSDEFGDRQLDQKVVTSVAFYANATSFVGGSLWNSRVDATTFNDAVANTNAFIISSFATRDGGFYGTGGFFLHSNYSVGNTSDGGGVSNRQRFAKRAGVSGIPRLGASMSAHGSASEISGKFYFEVRVETNTFYRHQGNQSTLNLGLMSSASSDTSSAFDGGSAGSQITNFVPGGSSVPGIGFSIDNTVQVNGATYNAPTSNTSTFFFVPKNANNGHDGSFQLDTPVVFGFAVDLDNGKVFVHKDGTYANTNSSDATFTNLDTTKYWWFAATHGAASDGETFINTRSGQKDTTFFHPSAIPSGFNEGYGANFETDTATDNDAS